MMDDKESIQHQVNEWVAGRPWHNTVRDECCPDFSCCRPDLIWPDEMRKEFAASDDQTQQEMCMCGLGLALTELSPEKSVHIAGKSSEH